MKWTRRGVLFSALATGATLSALRSHTLPLAYAGSGSVYIFAVTGARPRALQKSIEGALGGIDVTVFGRVGDFKRALGSAAPDAALAIAPVLKEFGLSPDLQGTQGGAAEEKYVVLSEDSLDQASLANKSIGCVDFVGRRALPKFAGKILGVSGKPKIQRVTKLEDLLQLLQFKRADAVMLPKRLAAELTSRTKMSLQTLELSASVKRMAVAFPGNRGAVEGGIKGLPGNVLKELGISGWK